MSGYQWRILIQLKELLSKVSNDKSLQGIDFSNLVEKLGLPLTTKELSKYLPQNISLDATALIPKKSDEKESKQSKPTNIPKWKQKSTVTLSAISSQVQYLLSVIETAEYEMALIDRLEIFNRYMKEFPEARNFAIKFGAVRLFLKIRSNSYSNLVLEPIREAMALIGFADPVPGKGIRILSMDGGGIRGLLVLEMLKKLEELTGKRVYELFDLLCGVSTGAILSYSLGIHRKNIDEIAKGYLEISNDVFKQSTLWGTGNLMWSQAFYDTNLWEKKLKERLGTNSLISTARDPKCPKLLTVSAVVNQSHLSAYLFRNYSLSWRVKSQYFGSSTHQVWEAARASAAAPTYFEEFKLGNFLHQDGGILVNNPTAVALHEAKLIWPNTPIQCVISFGTGRTVPIPSELKANKDISTSWANKFWKILDSATDTEGVHIMLNDLLPESVYYRFNPYLTETVGMTEINPKKLEQMQRDVIMYLRRNEDKFHEAAQALMLKKTVLQKTIDYLQEKRERYL